MWMVISVNELSTRALLTFTNVSSSVIKMTPFVVNGGKERSSTQMEYTDAVNGNGKVYLLFFTHSFKLRFVRHDTSTTLTLARKTLDLLLIWKRNLARLFSARICERDWGTSVRKRWEELRAATKLVWREGPGLPGKMPSSRATLKTTAPVATGSLSLKKQVGVLYRQQHCDVHLFVIYNFPMMSSWLMKSLMHVLYIVPFSRTSDGKPLANILLVARLWIHVTAQLQLLGLQVWSVAGRVAG